MPSTLFTIHPSTFINYVRNSLRRSINYDNTFSEGELKNNKCNREKLVPSTVNKRFEFEISEKRDETEMEMTQAPYPKRRHSSIYLEPVIIIK